jgi:S1-C subfamily serine protease
MKQLFFVVIALMVLSSCKDDQPTKLPDLSPQQLFEKFRTNVVLIKNKSYFKITFDNNTVGYFTSIYEGENIDFTLDETEAKKYAHENSGTGFFIGQDGIIATNMHVVVPSESMISKINFHQSIIESLQQTRDYAFNHLDYCVTLLKKTHPEDTAYLKSAIPATVLYAMSNNKEDIDEDDYRNPNDTSLNYLHHQIDSLVTQKEKLETLSSQKFKIEVVTAELSIQIDASSNNFNTIPCHLYSLSQDKNIDLALIQTNTLTKPTGIKEDINLTSKQNNGGLGNTIGIKDTLKVTTPLYLIGYNYGDEIAKTADGIKVQLTKGEVIQENDPIRVLYSIPTLPGSSGSPVFNKKGQIVAINYCGYNQKENFNYGIMSWHLKNLINAKPKLLIEE